MSTIPLIPRKKLFGNPDKANPKLSPDGKLLAFIAPDENVLNVWVGNANEIASASPVTRDRIRGVRTYHWAYTNRHILYIQDKGGDENWHVYCTDVATGETTDLTPYEGVAAQISEVSPCSPESILVGLNDRVPELHDLYEINILTGERTLVLENEGFMGFVTDDTYTPRLALRMTPEGGMNIFQRSENGDWSTFAEISMEDTMTTQPYGFDSTGRYLYMADSRGRDTGALFKVDMQTGKFEMLAEDPKADLAGVMVHPTQHTVQAANFPYTRRSWQVIDPAITGDLDYLKTVENGDLEVLSRSQDDQNWVVVFLMDNSPFRYYHYDRANRKANFLFTNRKELEGLPLAALRPVIIPARDGLNLVSYYSLPYGSDSQTPGTPDHPLPLVLLVHGGPWARDEWILNPWHQWLANRGYAVLSVNFRGSTGFGKTFVNAGNKEWGQRMHDDLVDAVQWAIQAKIADPSQVAIMGGSYGGYATLAGLTFTPELFACGVDIVGPSNLITLLESVPPYWKPMLDMLTTRVGDHRTEEGQALLKERSPLTHAQRIVRPLLIGQGANDPRVKQAESDQIVQAMQAKQIPVTYVLFPDEGHGFARPQNNLAFHAIAEAFLAGTLEGRFEAIGSDFEGSSIQVPSGAGLVPGLEENLNEK